MSLSPPAPPPPQDGTSLAAEIAALGRDARARMGARELAELRRTQRLSWLLSALGWGLAGVGVNPVSVVCIAWGRNLRWMMAHEIGHGTYDRIPGVPAHFTSRQFARGWRRYVDWFDWYHPDVWRHGHQRSHHARMQTPDDPDLVAEHGAPLHNRGLPTPARWGITLAAGCLWKTGQSLQYTAGWLRQREPDASDARVWWTWFRLSVLPFLVLYAIVIPALTVPLGVFTAVLVNGLLAEWFANLYSFIVSVPTHSGVPRFDQLPTDREERCLQRITGTVSYGGTGPLQQYLHLGLHHHIQHHLWADLPSTVCAALAPELRRICADHNVPIIFEPALRRWPRVVDEFIPPRRQR